MNLLSWINNVAMAGLTKVNFGQSRLAGLSYRRPMMLNTARVSKSIVGLAGALLAGSAFTASAQTNYYNPNGSDYAVAGSIPGDQVYPDVALSTGGGFLVWQDNATDGSGWGISARRLDGTLTGPLSPFRVNQTGTNDQENPHVSLLKNGGAVFVWQGGVSGFQHVYARFLTPTNTFLTTTDLLVSATTNHFQLKPVVTTLNNSNVVVAWSSFNEAGSNSMQDVYGQMLSPAGQKIGGQFLINQFTGFNQRTPALTALPNGGFVVAWVSEQQRIAVATGGSNRVDAAAGITTPSVDIYARLYNASGVPLGNEFLVNTDSSICANPSLAAATDGRFIVVWGGHAAGSMGTGWDIYGRTFSSAGVGETVVRINSYLIGDQYGPRVSSLALDYMVTWTSLGQDGSREGVFAQFVHEDGSLTGAELRVNTMAVGQQLHPVVAADGANQFLAVWTSYAGIPNSFDLVAKRYVNAAAVLQAMSAPFVYAPFVLTNSVYQPQLVVSWPSLLGISVSNYEVYVDGATTPMAKVRTNQWTMTAANGLTTNSTHSFQLDYTTPDGRRSPISQSASGSTWGGQSWGGIPEEWMTAYYGPAYSLVNGVFVFNWPSATAPLSPGGPTLGSVFLSGGNPTNPASWLKQVLTTTAPGMFLSWNTQPGATYQVITSTNLAAWNNVGSPRFAAGTNDSIFIGGNAVGYYRLVLLR